MYTLEKRMEAVQLYIDSNFNEGTVIKTLGYPSPNTLRSWYREFSTSNMLHEKVKYKPRYTEEQIMSAVDYYASHKGSLTQTCRALGYPTRAILKGWIRELHPDLLKRKTDACTKKRNLVRYSSEQKQTAVEAMTLNHIPDYKIAAQYGVSKATVNNWKKLVLGKGGIQFMAKQESNPNATKDELEATIVELKKQIRELQMERDALQKATEILKKADGINLKSLKNEEKAELIGAMRKQYRLTELLQLFSISKSSYFYSAYAILYDKYSETRDKIIKIFEDNNCCYGYRRIHIILKRQGSTVSEKVVRRIMKQEALTVPVSARKKYSSYKGEISPEVANLISRDFHAETPYQKWLTDLTEFALPAGKVYLSPIIDCFDGLVHSWSIGTSPNANLVNTMLERGLASLPEGAHPIIHSDRGCHYRWPEWIEKVTSAGLTRSMSRKGCSPDNSACEGFFGRLKNEMFYGRTWAGVSLDQFIEILNRYIYWYNEKRVKLSLGGLSPIEYRRILGLA